SLFLCPPHPRTRVLPLSLHDALPICDLPVGERLDDLLAVPAGVLGFLDPKFRCFIGKKHQLLLFLIARLEPRRRSSSLAIKKRRDRKSTRLNSSHLGISYAVFCLKKK